MALRLKSLTKTADIRKKALEVAHRARNLFFWDRFGRADRPVVAACFKDTADPNPWLEQMFAVDRARVQEGNVFQLYRCIAKRNEVGEVHTPALELITCEAVAQLRAPYTERIVQVVGGHVSRIGVDFFSAKK
jgi:hypothetical protein